MGFTCLPVVLATHMGTCTHATWHRIISAQMCRFVHLQPPLLRARVVICVRPQKRLGTRRQTHLHTHTHTLGRFPLWGSAVGGLCRLLNATCAIRWTRSLCDIIMRLRLASQHAADLSNHVIQPLSYYERECMCVCACDNNTHIVRRVCANV